MTQHRLPRAALALVVPLLALPLAACSGLRHASDPAPVVRGPLPLRNLHPLALTYLALRPRRAATQPPGAPGLALDLSYSSIFEEDVDRTRRDAVAFDAEILRVALRGRFGLDERTDVEVELAGLHASGGFLDSVIDDFHNVTFLPGGGRDSAERNEYAARIVHDTDVAYELVEDEVGLGDVPVTVTRALRIEDERGPGVALRAGIELPLGDEDEGFGNGAIDWGAGVVIEKSLGRWTVFGAADWVVPADSDGFEDADLEARDLVQAQVGGEYRWNDRMSLLGQLFLTTPFVREITLEEIDREILLLGLGCAWDLGGGGRLSFSFNEDVVAATGPDFSVLLGLSWGF